MRSIPDLGGIRKQAKLTSLSTIAILATTLLGTAGVALGNDASQRSADLLDGCGEYFRRAGD